MDDRLAVGVDLERIGRGQKGSAALHHLSSGRKSE
jgi:hypothetical protein